MSHTGRVAPLALVLLAACAAGQSAPVPLRGDLDGIAQLAGTWGGSYENPVAARSGSISFTLTAGDDHAHGDVVMIAAGTSEPFRPFDDRHALQIPPRAALLTIDFVRIRGDSVAGRIAPYFDPDCGCATVARFRGRVNGGRIAGTFEAQQANGRMLTGTWSVGRQQP